ncbi:hypothetical protein ACFOUP_18230 [Belliella kenyensis]|uniref:TolB-like 6-blade propeller-like n=1 Tax=Belliella kenyensis TaxID=1472724 RepID=A0ABV8EPR1_9BACT|nr:hypothetical protein [Belliella kenyensis]MCH7402280.1 hypothetical protein [Belliella kenyensis]MDN3601797.1 hypothetical protein [Belliella kenyensis]
MKNYFCFILIGLLFGTFSCKAPNSNELVDFTVSLKDYDMKLSFKRVVNELGELVKEGEYFGKIEEPKIYNNQIYGIDRRSWSIVLFDEDFNISRTYGKMGEDAYDENFNFFNYSVSDSLYWVLEPNRYLFKIFDHHDNIIHLEKLAVFSNSAIETENNTFIFAHDDYEGKNIEFSSLDNQGNFMFLYNLKDIIADSGSNEIENFDLIYEGWLYASKEYIVYVCFKSDDFFVFDSSMEHLYNSKTVYKLPLPKILAESNFEQTVFKTDPPFIFNSYSQISGKNLFILNPVSKEKIHYIDVYDLESFGEYNYSIKVPFLDDGQVPISFVVKDSSIVIFYENMTIKEFRYMSQEY